MSLKSRVAAWHIRKAKDAITAAFTYSQGPTSSTTFDGAKIRGNLRSIYGGAKTLDHAGLRDRSREAFWDSTQGGAILQRLVDNVIGTGLKLEYTPTWDFIGGGTKDTEERRKFCREVELKWYLWASSHEPDAAERRNLDELMAFAFMAVLRDGEAPTALRYDGDPERISPLSLQFYDPDQIGDVYEREYTAAVEARGNILRDGVETTPAGKVVAIYLREDYLAKPTRFAVMSPSGRRRFLILPALLDLPGQVRGTGVLGPVLHELQKLTDYELFELEAALLNAIIAAFIAPGKDSDTRTNISNAIGGGVKSRTGAATSDTTAETGGETRIRQAGLFIGNIKKGETIESFDTKRPNVNFDGFVSSVTKHLSARISIPVEVLEEKFSSNYSASRASLILAWKTFDRWKGVFVSQWLQPVFEAWFGEMVAKKEIAAPGYEETPIQKRAWLTTGWIGDSLPSIDPLKEADADKERLAQGATSFERNALKYNGSDYYDNMEKQAEERKVLPKIEAPAVAGGQPPEPEKDDGEDDDPDSMGGEETDFEGLKQEMDSYGVAVRAGAITPQVEDEDHFRARAGFPPASKSVKSAWSKDGGTRRPVTLTPPPGSPSTPSAPAQEKPEKDDGEDDEE